MTDNRKHTRRWPWSPVVTAAIIVAVVAVTGVAVWLLSDKPRPAEEVAMEGASTAAQVYYEGLLNGDCRLFLAGKAGADTLPAAYQEQLVDAYSQFLDQQRQTHGGLCNVQLNRAVIDSAMQAVQVFLLLCYADSTQEEIVVPMVEQQGVWKMR